MEGHIMPILPEIPPDLIDFLIQKQKKEQKEQKEQEDRPYLQIPAPNMPQIPPKKAEKKGENEENGAIIMDI